MMVYYKKCIECMHDGVCSKKVEYISACNRISNEADKVEKDAIIVDIKCSHYFKDERVRNLGD